MIKKTIILAIAAVMFVSATATAQALNEKSEIAAGPAGRLMLEKHREEGMIAREDRLTIEKDGKVKVIFASEGRAIEQVLHANFDGSPGDELLIVMELGGSAGMLELALFQYKAGNYQQIWEETGFSAGKIALADEDGDKNPEIIIDYFTDDTPAREARSIYTCKNGKIKLLKTTPANKAG
ncbi:MAG: hypothetical protein PHD82_12980 [Candidatus Riflebacteria bacterium]|nr:hypothetical protein [Candidatus Riflebacteria bacterium]